jgi:hypothetical protein
MLGRAMFTIVPSSTIMSWHVTMTARARAARLPASAIRSVFVFVPAPAGAAILRTLIAFVILWLCYGNERRRSTGDARPRR